MNSSDKITASCTFCKIWSRYKITETQFQVQRTTWITLALTRNNGLPHSASFLPALAASSYKPTHVIIQITSQFGRQFNGNRTGMSEKSRLLAVSPSITRGNFSGRQADLRRPYSFQNYKLLLFILALVCADCNTTSESACGFFSRPTILSFLEGWSFQLDTVRWRMSI